MRALLARAAPPRAAHLRARAAAPRHRAHIARIFCAPRASAAARCARLVALAPRSSRARSSRARLRALSSRLLPQRIMVGRRLRHRAPPRARRASCRARAIFAIYCARLHARMRAARAPFAAAPRRLRARFKHAKNSAFRICAPYIAVLARMFISAARIIAPSSAPAFAPAARRARASCLVSCTSARSARALFVRVHASRSSRAFRSRIVARLIKLAPHLHHSARTMYAKRQRQHVLLA